MSERPSGWYPDPNDETLLRYWDGILWTDRTMPRIKPGLERSTISTPPQLQQPPYGQQPQPPYGQGPQQPPYGGPQRPQQPYGPPYGPAKPIARTPDGQELSGWWRRVLALVIDGFLCTLVAIPLSWHWLGPWLHDYADWFSAAMKAAEKGQSRPDFPQTLAEQFPWQFALVTAAVSVAYETVLTAATGRTLGKLITGIRVRRAASDRRPSLGAALYRTLIKNVNSLTSAVPFLGLLGVMFQLLDYLRPLSDVQRRSFHDQWAGTYVVRSKQKS